MLEELSQEWQDTYRSTQWILRVCLTEIYFRCTPAAQAVEQRNTLFLSHSCVALDLCSGSLSCWKTCSPKLLVLDSRRFSSRISLLFSSVDFTSLPGLLQGSSSQHEAASTMIHSRDDVFLFWCAVFGLTPCLQQTEHLEVMHQNDFFLSKTTKLKLVFYLARIWKLILGNSVCATE